MRCVFNHLTIIYYYVDRILHDSTSLLNHQMQNTGKSNREDDAYLTIVKTAILYVTLETKIT